MLAPRLLAVMVIATSFATACSSERHEHGTPAPVAQGGVVTLPPFDSVELRGGGHVTLRYGADQRVTLVQGSADVTRFWIARDRKLVIDACESNCPMDYHLEVDIVMPHLAAAAISGGGRIESAAGFPPQDTLAAAVEGGGDLDLHALNVASAQAAVEGGGKIRIHADRELTAAVDGGGSIHYSGTAEVTRAINGGGSIRPED
jgi:hypothetical protein